MRIDSTPLGAALVLTVRRSVSLSIVILLLLAGGTAGCGDDDSGSGNNLLGGGDAGVCNKDRDELAQLLAQPQACATSETCPTGSHCSEAGQCDWQCIADSDCGSGFTCSCDGRCILEGSGDSDAGVAVDPSCPRDRDLLVDGMLQKACSTDTDCPPEAHCNTTTGRCQLDTNPKNRACILDENCPYGSYCNSGTGRCAYDCLGTSDPDLPCNGPIPTDATSNWFLPTNASEWTDLLQGTGLASPSSVWLLQEPSGSVADSIGTRTGTVVGSVTYQVPASGWTRKGIKVTTDNSTSHIRVPTPDASTKSLLFAQVLSLNTNPPSGFRALNCLGATQYEEAQLVNGIKMRGQSGANIALGTQTYSGTVLVVTKLDHARNQFVVYTDSGEILKASFQNQNADTHSFLLGDDLSSSDATLLYATLFTGSAAELSDSQVATLIQRIKNGPGSTTQGQMKVCDCRGRCVDPAAGCGAPSDESESTRIVMSLDRDWIDVPTAPWTAQEPLKITLRSDVEIQPEDYPKIQLEAPTGIFLDGLSTLEIDTWTFELEDGAYVAEKTIQVTGPTLMPTLLPGPWPITITGTGVTSLPRTVLVEHKPPTTTPGVGLYSGTITAKNSAGTGITSIPVTAWVNGSFILFFDNYRALSPAGMFGIHRAGLPSFTMGKWLGSSDGGQVNVGLVTSAVPTQQSNGDLKNGKLAVYVAIGQDISLLNFDFDLQRRGDLTAKTCAEGCESTEHCEAALGYCAPGPDWTVADWGQPLVSGLADRWVDASSWFLNNNTPGLFGIPGMPGSNGIGRVLQCLPANATLTSTTGSNVRAGFIHTHSHDPNRTISGDIASSLSNWPEQPLCMQPIPLGLNRDNEKYSAIYPNSETYPFILGGEDLLTTCLEEALAEPPAVTGFQADNALAWFGTPSYCMSPSRLYPMLEWVLDYNFNRGEQTSGVEARGLHAVLSRWLAGLSFMADQSTKQWNQDRATSLDSESVSTSRILSSISLFESAMRLMLGGRMTEALYSLPSDVLTNPDYRDVRPVAYYTFDIEDMNGIAVHDVTGKRKATLQNTGWSRPPASPTCTQGWQQCEDGIITTQTMTIPRGPAELYGDFQVAFSFQMPSVPPFGQVVLLEYGDVNDVLYQILATDVWGVGIPEISVRHGSRSSPSMVVTSQLFVGQTAHLLVSRRVGYSFSGANPVWQSEYTAYLNGVPSLGPQTSSIPLVTSLSFPTTAQGKFNITGYANDLAMWDEPAMPGDDHHLRAVRPATGHDNYQFDVLTPQLNIGTDGNHEQPVGLAAVLLEAMTSYLSTTSVATSGFVGDAYAGCVLGTGAAERQEVIERGGQALRYSWLAEVMAAGLYARASTRRCSQDEDCRSGETCENHPNGSELQVCTAAGIPAAAPPVPWKDRYERALAEVDAARSRLVRELDTIVNCRDPFGISPAAVPLYFGDPVGTNARFFASSDYLLNTWAIPAVSRADTSLDQARNAWLNKRNSEIQQLQNEYQRAARLEDIKTRYAQPLIELCGLGGVDPLAAFDTIQTIDPENCFRVPTPWCQTADGRERADCYRGEMGKAALTIVAAWQGVDVASKSAAAKAELFKNQHKFCSDKEARLEGDLHALQMHNDAMRALRNEQAVVGMVTGFLSSIVSQNPFGWLGDTVRNDYENRMRQAEVDFQQTMTARANEETILSCYHDADQIKVGIDVEYAVIRQRLLDVELAVLQLQNYKSQILQLKTESRAVYAREEVRTVPSVAHHYWLDSKIDRYKRDFEWARRVTMLAVRAVEYEFQQSIPAGAEVLRAASVDDLDEVVAELQQEQASRTINGRRPQETSVVVSLRDDVMKMFGRDSLSPSVIPAGERTWSAETRFGKQLGSELFAMYDNEGNYLGQGIPFTLRETGALKYRCAERLWRVNATIQGDIPGMSTPSVPVMLLKRNTFSSQWCDGRGDGTAMQQGSVFPSANLFDLQGGPTNDDEADASTAALLMPWFNVIRSEFYKEQYVEGSSEEFAGRGLYGDYVLLFPESGLLEWTDGQCGNDFPLSRIEDVLLRFDLISVDDLQL